MNLQRLFFCILSSALLWSSFPRLDWECAAWIAFVPWLFAIAKTTKRRAFWLSYLSGFLFFLATLAWLVQVTLAGLIILCFYLAFYFAFFGYFFAGVTKRLPVQRFSVIIFLSCLWVLLEYLRGALLSGFPWALVGYSQYQNIAFIQFADSTGALGTSFAVVFVNLCVFALVQQFLKRNSTVGLKFVLAIAAVFLATYSYGLYSLAKYSSMREQGAVLRVALLQGNIAQEQKWQSVYRAPIKAHYRALSREAALSNPDVIIWPETSFPDSIVDGDQGAMSEIFDVVKETGRPLLFGAIFEAGDSYFNAAFLVAPRAQHAQLYRKIHLVPFGEYIPLRRYLPFLEQLIPIGDFEAGKEYAIFQANNRAGEAFDFGVLICFEDTMPELARQFRLRGADFLVNITNDAWFGESASPYQHLQASVFRAVENRAYVLRAANTGISCIIDENGRIAHRVKDAAGKDIFVRGFIRADARKSKALSFYTRAGDWFVVLCAAYIFLFAIYLGKKMCYDISGTEFSNGVNKWQRKI